VVRDTSVRRLTQGGDWSFATDSRVASLYPQSEGGLVILTTNGERGKLLRLRPPESSVSDSLVVDSAALGVMSPIGDRLYLAAGRELLALNATAFSVVARVGFEAPIVALTTTPSGDRVFVAAEGRPAVDVVNRYTGKRESSVSLPCPVRELRIDPLGRLLLARPDSGDSVLVISVGTGKHITTLHSAWRSDLPTVAADGAVVTVVGKDVEFTIPGQANPRIRVREGAAEVWHFVLWNGFRPRAKGLDQPVVFQEDNTAAAFGTPSGPDTGAAPPPRVDSSPAPPPSPPDTAARAPAGRGEQWTVSFAALLSDTRAHALAQGITVDGHKARVVVSAAEGVQVYRVILGPYASRAEAERVGRASRRSYWVFEGVP
jgi:cell division septation protein DedD